MGNTPSSPIYTAINVIADDIANNVAGTNSNTTSPPPRTVAATNVDGINSNTYIVPTISPPPRTVAATSETDLRRFPVLSTIVAATSETDLRTRFPVLYNMYKSITNRYIVNGLISGNVSKSLPDKCMSPLLSGSNCLPDVIKDVLIGKSNIPTEGNIFLNYEQILKDFLEISGLNSSSYPPNSPEKYSDLNILVRLYAGNNNIFTLKIEKVLNDVKTSQYKSTYWGS